MLAANAFESPAIRVDFPLLNVFLQALLLSVVTPFGQIHAGFLPLPPEQVLGKIVLSFSKSAHIPLLPFVFLSRLNSL